MQDKIKLLANAKRMRHVPTEAESTLWRQLRAGRLAAYKFKRQQPLGDFIVDFVCFAQKLVIEVDGGQHVELQAHDEAHTAWLQAQGFRVLRFWNHDVLQRRDLVLEEILRQLKNGRRDKAHLSPCGARRVCRAERSMRLRGGRGQAERQYL